METNPPFATWFEDFTSKLRETYALPDLGQRNKCECIEKLIEAAPRIQKQIDFDLDEFAVAVWLWFVDQPNVFRHAIEARGSAWAEKNYFYFENLICDEEDIKNFVRIRGTDIYCRELLEWSPFNEDARDRIVKAICERKDPESDSILLIAIRMAHGEI